jgi:hypothetical protein
MNKGRITSRIRIQILGLLMLLGMGALCLRLWWIQVSRRGMDFTASWQFSSDRAHPSVRGEIKDCNGVTLVRTAPAMRSISIAGNGQGYRERFGSPPLSEYRAIINGAERSKGARHH